MSCGRVLPYQGVMEHGCTIGSTRTESAFYGTRAEAFLLKQQIRHSWRWCNLSLNTTKFPQQPIVPWYFSSDSSEQTYAFLRTGRQKGRRKILSSTDVMTGTARMNRSLELDKDGLHLMRHLVVHMRGKTLILKPKETKMYCGKIQVAKS